MLRLHVITRNQLIPFSRALAAHAILAFDRTPAPNSILAPNNASSLDIVHFIWAIDAYRSLRGRSILVLMLSSKKTTILTSFSPTLFLVFLDRLPHNHLHPLDPLPHLPKITLLSSSQRIILSHLQHLVSLLLPRQIPLSIPHNPIFLISLTTVSLPRKVSPHPTVLPLVICHPLILSLPPILIFVPHPL